MAVEWHYILGGVQKGPAPASELKRLAAEGRLTGDSLIWRDGLPKWVPARMV